MKPCQAVYLRVVYFDRDGKAFLPKGAAEVLMPMALVPGMRRTVRDFLAVRPQNRTYGIASTVARERAKAKPTFYGMAVISCPEPTEIARLYHVTMATCSPGGDIVHSQWTQDSLVAARRRALSVAQRVASVSALANA